MKKFNPPSCENRLINEGKINLTRNKIIEKERTPCNENLHYNTKLQEELSIAQLFKVNPNEMYERFSTVYDTLTLQINQLRCEIKEHVDDERIHYDINDDVSELNSSVEEDEH